MSWGLLATDSYELLITRRRLSLHAEWLLDRLRLWAAATDTQHSVLRTDLALVLDRKLTTQQADAAIDELVAQELVTEHCTTFELTRWLP